ncbi:MAG TPA: chloride channel protein [Candidatus Acidoferrum sp.]|nr:chloride channel protein [Candidatus Acidoferrum sp.]
MSESNPAPAASIAEPVPVAAQANAFSIRLLRDAVGRWLVSLGEDRLFLLLAVLIGIFSGIAVVWFRIAIEFTSFFLLGSSLAPSIPRVLIAPTLAGIGVALLVLHVFPQARGSGVNQTKSAMYVLNGYIPFRTVIGKFIVCALAIGSGQSLGPEDPSLQMGAGIASAIGRKLHLSQRKIRLIAPVGAAAGLAAAFNAPISAVLFVIEEVIGTWSAGVLGAIVLAAVSSVVTMRWFLGKEALFRVPPFQLVRPWEVLAYVVLGVVGGLASLGFLKWLAYARPRMQALPNWTHYFQPAAAGLLIGVIGIRFPQVLGAGYAVIDQALHGQFTWKLLILLAVLKILATGVSFLSGTPGGMFAPSLFIGAMLGGAVGSIEQHFFPALTGTIGTFALVGMGTFFAGFLRVPITSVFMVIEVSGNYTAIVPVMISSLVAYLISRHYQKVPLFDMLSRQDGLVLPSIEELREQVALVVEDAMRPNAAIVVVPGDLLTDIANRISKLALAASEREKVAAPAAASSEARAEAKPEIPVLCRVKVGEWRLLDREQVLRLAAESPQAPPEISGDAPEISNLKSGIPGDAATPTAGQPLTAADLDSKGPLPMIFPDEALEEVLRWTGDWPVLPVVNRADLGKLEGVLTLPDILRAFRHAATE